MIKSIQNYTLTFKSNIQPIEKSLYIHNKLISNGFYDMSKTNNNNSRFEYLYSEIDEFKQAVEKGDKKEMEEEIGDVIFDAVLLADYYNIDPTKALSKTNKKIDTRINLAQEFAQIPLTQYPFETRMKFWEMAKSEIKKQELKERFDETI